MASLPVSLRKEGVASVGVDYGSVRSKERGVASVKGIANEGGMACVAVSHSKGGVSF